MLEPIELDFIDQAEEMTEVPGGESFGMEPNEVVLGKLA